MAYEQKPGGGVLFKNNKKNSDKHPDYTGNFLDVNGEKWNIAAWVKEGNKGKFFSLKISAPREQDNGNELPF